MQPIHSYLLFVSLIYTLVHSVPQVIGADYVPSAGLTNLRAKVIVNDAMKKIAASERNEYKSKMLSIQQEKDHIALESQDANVVRNKKLFNAKLYLQSKRNAAFAASKVYDKLSNEIRIARKRLDANLQRARDRYLQVLTDSKTEASKRKENIKKRLKTTLKAIKMDHALKKSILFKGYKKKMRLTKLAAIKAIRLAKKKRTGLIAAAKARRLAKMKHAVAIRDKSIKTAKYHRQHKEAKARLIKHLETKNTKTKTKYWMKRNLATYRNAISSAKNLYDAASKKLIYLKVSSKRRQAILKQKLRHLAARMKLIDAELKHSLENAKALHDEKMSDIRQKISESSQKAQVQISNLQNGIHKVDESLQRQKDRIRDKLNAKVEIEKEKFEQKRIMLIKKEKQLIQKEKEKYQRVLSSFV